MKVSIKEISSSRKRFYVISLNTKLTAKDLATNITKDI